MKFQLKYNGLEKDDEFVTGINKNRVMITSILYLLKIKGLDTPTEEEYNKMDNYGKSLFIGK